MLAAYNDNDPHSATWMRGLMAFGLIPDGEIVEGDIATAKIPKADQLHLFAGIAGWPLALEMAGWDGPVMTGSCPCQPFSIAGQGKAEKDERHLWPDMLAIIERTRPPVVVGEQVTSRKGLQWLAGVRADVEQLGYRFCAADLPAATVAAPHIRQRNWWAAVQPGHRIEVKSPTNRQPRPWDESLVLACRDGKARRAGVPPVAPKVAGRAAMLRGFGNAIVPHVAEIFLRLLAEVSGESNMQGALTRLLLELIDVDASPECRLKWRVPASGRAQRAVPDMGDLFGMEDDDDDTGAPDELFAETGFPRLSATPRRGVWPSVMGGWRTPATVDGKRGTLDPEQQHERSRLALGESVDVAHWPTVMGERTDDESVFARGNPKLGTVAQLANWPTATFADAQNSRPTIEGAEAEFERRGGANGYQNLALAVSVLAIWPTPNVPNGGRAIQNAYLENGTWYTDKGRKAQVGLEVVTKLAVWPTPVAMDGRRGGRDSRPHDKGKPLTQIAVLANWGTPKATNGPHSGASLERGHDARARIEDQALGSLWRDGVDPWATAAARDYKDTPGMATEGVNPDGTPRTRLDQLPRQVPGSAYGHDGERLMLNPLFSGWLMGYRPEWLAAYCEAKETA